MIEAGGQTTPGCAHAQAQQVESERNYRRLSLRSSLANYFTENYGDKTARRRPRSSKRDNLESDALTEFSPGRLNAFFCNMNATFVPQTIGFRSS